jgi:hypothetical protein
MAATIIAVIFLFSFFAGQVHPNPRDRSELLFCCEPVPDIHR